MINQRIPVLIGIRLYVYYFSNRHGGGVGVHILVAWGLVCSAVDRILIYTLSVTRSIGTAALQMAC